MFNVYKMNQELSLFTTFPGDSSINRPVRPGDIYPNPPEYTVTDETVAAKEKAISTPFALATCTDNQKKAMAFLQKAGWRELRWTPSNDGPYKVHLLGKHFDKPKLPSTTDNTWAGLGCACHLFLNRDNLAPNLITGSMGNGRKSKMAVVSTGTPLGPLIESALKLRKFRRINGSNIWLKGSVPKV